jgi:hypothetical protein
MKELGYTIKLIELKRHYLRLPRCQLCLKMGTQQQQLTESGPQEANESSEEDGR